MHVFQGHGGKPYMFRFRLHVTASISNGSPRARLQAQNPDATTPPARTPHPGRLAGHGAAQQKTLAFQLHWLQTQNLVYPAASSPGETDAAWHAAAAASTAEATGPASASISAAAKATH